MSFDVQFDFSTGLSQPLQVPKGTKVAYLKHVASIEETLGLKRTKNTPESAPYWDHWDKAYRAGWPKVDDKLLCETIEAHNTWVRRVWDDFIRWTEGPVSDGEVLTPEDAAEFWPGLTRLTVRPDRWTADYFRARMEAIYETMRGRQSEGMHFDAGKLTVKQAAAVIQLFDQYLDPSDLRLDVPHGRDYLASSYDGGYDWCGKCFRAIAPGDQYACWRRACELKEQD